MVNLNTEPEPSLSTYPEGYQKPIEKKILALADDLNLNSSHALRYALQHPPKLPKGAEEWSAIPSREGLEFLFPDIRDETARYCAGVELVHEKIARKMPFNNHQDRLEIVPGCLQIDTRTAHALALLEEKQPGQILVVATQSGLYYRDHSVPEARQQFENRREFGLGSLAVGSMILTNPERLLGKAPSVLGMECPGDRFLPPLTDKGDFCNNSAYCVTPSEEKEDLDSIPDLQNNIEFYLFWEGWEFGDAGAVTGFLHDET